MFQTNPHFSEPSALARLAASVDPALRDQAVFMLLGAVLTVILFLGLRGALTAARMARLRRAAAGNRGGKPELAFDRNRFFSRPRAMHDPANQMKAISQVGFRTIRLLNASEYKLLPLLESIARDLRRGHRVMAQTSLGEILAPVSDDAGLKSAAFASINSKRLDFAIFDTSGYLVLAIEYQGQAHYRPTAFMRDAVKREALRKAGVPFLEVPAMFRPAEVRAEIVGLLQPVGDQRPQPSAAARSSGAPMA